jgi:GNAT superfamily N-acetyltransferase
VTIRDARPDDLDEILALVHELATYERAPEAVTFDRDVFASHVFGDDAVAHALIAEDDGAVAGFALYFRTFSTWLGRDGIWLEDLFVRPEYRKRGHGGALLAEIRARTKGRVEWSMLDWNELAGDFYRGLGAEQLGGWVVWRWENPE